MAAVGGPGTGIRQARAKNEIHAVLMRRLKGRPPASDLFGIKGRNWLVDAGLRHIAFLDGEIAEVERVIALDALAWPTCAG